MADSAFKPFPLQGFSEDEQHLFETFGKELQQTIETLKVEKQKNYQFKKQKLQLQIELDKTHEKMEEMRKIHELQKEKIKHEFQEKIKQVQSTPKNHTKKIISPIKKKTIKPQTPTKVQNPQSVPKSLTKGFKFMLLQQFIQFFAALVLTKIKFPHKFRSLRRILPITFILLRLGIFVLVTQFRKVCAYVRSVATGEEGSKMLTKKIETVMVFLSHTKSREYKEAFKKIGFGDQGFLRSVFPFF